MRSGADYEMLHSLNCGIANWRKRVLISAVLLASLLAPLLFAFQRPFREYPAVEYNDFPIPADFQEKTEWVFARLMYPPAPRCPRIRVPRPQRGDWASGIQLDAGLSSGRPAFSRRHPTFDPYSCSLRRAARESRRRGRCLQLALAVRCAGGRWVLTDARRETRDYLLRGGFFMADDFWGLTMGRLRRKA